MILYIYYKFISHTQLNFEIEIGFKDRQTDITETLIGSRFTF